jgi:methyl acetate hydrolase
VTFDTKSKSRALYPRKGVTILKPETVKNFIFTDQIPLAIPNITSPNFTPQGTEISAFPSVEPTISNNGTIFPGVAKGWSMFLLNNESLPGERSNGSGAWAGVQNLYYCVDPIQGKLGVIFTALLPFLDEEILDLYGTFEKEVYAV